MSTMEKSGARLVSRMVIVSGVPSSDLADCTDNVYKDSGALAEAFAAAADHGSTARSSETVKCRCIWCLTLNMSGRPQAGAACRRRSLDGRVRHHGLVDWMFSEP
jgi:hypothetical protein